MTWSWSFTLQLLWLLIQHKNALKLTWATSSRCVGQSVANTVQAAITQWGGIISHVNGDLKFCAYIFEVTLCVSVWVLTLQVAVTSEGECTNKDGSSRISTASPSPVSCCGDKRALGRRFSYTSVNNRQVPCAGQQTAAFPDCLTFLKFYIFAVCYGSLLCL